MAASPSFQKAPAETQALQIGYSVRLRGAMLAHFCAKANPGFDSGVTKIGDAQE
jgi:hypothetical protein